MNKDESIIIDGKEFKKSVYKYYTLEQYEAIKDTLKHTYVEDIKRDVEGKFRVSNCDNHWDAPAEVIGKAVFDWYTPLPRNVREAIDALEKEPCEENAAMFLAALKVALRSPDNNLSEGEYPALMIRGHENCWDTDSAWAKIELWEKDGKIGFAPWAKHGPGEYHDAHSLLKFSDEETRCNCFKVIQLALRNSMNSVNSWEVMCGNSEFKFSHSRYAPSEKSYKSFCKTFMKLDPVEMLNTYEFSYTKTQEGYNPWSHSHNCREETKHKKVQAKSKKEAYELFKGWIKEKNESYGRMWFPGTEGIPHLKARPMSEGYLTFKPKKGEIYC